jgi:DNA-binding transcriptional ArsR family regulator
MSIFMPESRVDDERLVRVLKALADPKRFRMVQELARAGELSCGMLGCRFSVTQPTISHHLRVLGEAGVLVMRHEGQHHFVSVNRELLDEVGALLPVRLFGGARQDLPVA